MGSLHFPIAFGHVMHQKKFQLSRWSGSSPSGTLHFRPQMGPKYKGNGQNFTNDFVLAITFDPMHIFKFLFH